MTIDRAGIPAKDALRLCLKPLGLTYRVQSGYIRIVPDAYRPVPFEEDPLMIAGHSLLALIAAAVGGAGRRSSPASAAGTALGTSPHFRSRSSKLASSAAKSGLIVS